MKSKLTSLLALSALAVSIPVAHGATVAAYTFATNTSPTTQLANTSTTAITSTGFTYNQATSGRSSGFGGAYYTRGAQANAFTAYSQFKVTPAAGYTIDLTDLSFDFVVSGSDSTDWSSFQLRYSLDNGTNFIVAPDPTVTGFEDSVIEVQARSPLTTIDSTASYDLGSLGAVTETNGVIFRLYVSANELNGAGIIQYYDNFKVTGNVAAIPEPAAALLGCVGLLTLLRRRR